MISPLFLAHGSPMMAIQDNVYSRFLETYGAALKPKAVVIFTAHWERETTTVSAIDGVYDTIYDFGGFPPELYAVQYPAPGSPELAADVVRRFEAAGLAADTDNRRGLDHGSWVLLRRLFPRADIPVVQVSVHPFLPPEDQHRIGAALRELPAEDVLVIGSGVTVHNLRAVDFRATAPSDWAVAFDDWLIDKLAAGDDASLFRYVELAPYATAAVPRPEHFVPLFIARGAGSGGVSNPQVIHRSYEFGSLSYLSLAF